MTCKHLSPRTGEQCTRPAGHLGWHTGPATVLGPSALAPSGVAEAFAAWAPGPLEVTSATTAELHAAVVRHVKNDNFRRRRLRGKKRVVPTVELTAEVAPESRAVLARVLREAK